MKRLFGQPAHILYLLFDFLVVFGVSFLTLIYVKDFDNFVADPLPSLIYSLCLALATVLFFLVFKIYRVITKDIGLYESAKIYIITFAVQCIGFVVAVLLPSLPKFTLYIWPWLSGALLMSFALVGERAFVRMINLLMLANKKRKKVRTIVIGAGVTGKVAIDESRRNPDNHNQIVAVVDDDPNKIGGSLASLPVKGPISEIKTIIDFFQAEEVIIAMSKISEERLREILSLLDSCSVRVRRMPLIGEMQGPNDKRIIDVDLDELLCREPVRLDNHEINNMLDGKTVLVTGAGGSIGSELVRQIFNTHPATLVLFDIYENSLYDIQMELMARIRDERIKDIKVVALIGSTYNDFRVEQILKKYKPDYIYHAAAYKHVPLMEDSPAEAIRTNVIGTYNVARLASKYKVKKMVLVSTDKAVRPTNVMGATKRFAETIIQYFASKSETTAYAAVRFGNVLGSNGSVVPLFKKQIEAGGPVTITHRDIIRYFMTIPEAVALILQCGLFAEGGEIFILDMGKPVKIMDLAEKLIRQAGLIPGVDIEIVETGLRPGEKLYEELLLDISHQQKTSNKKIYIEEKEDVKPIEEEIKEISKVFEMEETESVKELLASIIKTYRITENND